MSQIGYANPQAQHPRLGPLTTPAADRNIATKSRTWAIVPLAICLIANIMFLLQYWIPETSEFPGHLWWMTQLGPLASPGLVTGGEPLVQPQADYAVPGAFILLVSSIVLVCLSRTRRWWGRIAVLLPAAVGLLTSLGMLVSMLTTGGNRTSALSVMLLLLWMVAAGYAANQGLQDRLGHPPPKLWRSGLPVLLAYAVVAPVPTAVGRWLFAPELRDVAIELRGNTVGLRLSALWSVSTAWVYLAGLLVGVTIWVMYRWWPTRPGSPVTALLVAIAVMLLFTGGVGWTAASMAADRVRQLREGSPAHEAVFTCGALELDGDSSQPARTIAVTGAGCRTVTILEGYRQVSTQVLPVSVSPMEAKTPEGGEISSRLVTAQYGPVLVMAGSDRMDRAPSTLLGLRIVDGRQLWRLDCTDALTVRFARVPAGDDPPLGHITTNESTPTVVVGCAGRTVTLDPAVGPT
jgi:hypothetical protein